MTNKFLGRYLDGDTSEEENRQIEIWLDRDPEKHQAMLNSVRLLHAIADHYLSEAAPMRKPVQKPVRRWTLRRIGCSIAAVAASIAVLLGVWQLSERNTYHDLSNRVAKMETPAGQCLKVKLEDGTDVWLNAGTTLEYPPVFDRTVRRVRLSGEAMFEVQHDAQRPFIVETFTSQIEVLGTKFNVRADEQMNRFRTTLIEGSVKVTSLLNPSEVITMNPNDEVALVDGKLRRTNADLGELCWTEGLVYIKKMPFDELMNYFEKAYDVKIVIARSTLPKIELQSGKIRVSDGVDYALQVLQEVSDFTYRYDEKKNLIEIR